MGLEADVSAVEAVEAVEVSQGRAVRKKRSPWEIVRSTSPRPLSPVKKWGTSTALIAVAVVNGAILHSASNSTIGATALVARHDLRDLARAVLEIPLPPAPPPIELREKSEPTTQEVSLPTHP